MADALKIVVLEGDETGQELLEQALLVLRPEVIGIELDLDRYDLSLEHRRATANAVVVEAARAMREAGYGVKAATVTPEGRDDVGSPNRILREEVDGKVIIRTGRRIPGVTPIAGVHHPISVVRMAVEDAYGAKQWREGTEGRRTRSPTARRRSHARRAARWRSTPSARRARWAARSTAGRNGPSHRSMRACSRRSSTRRRRAIPR
jgi:isocitrate dehydrogenase